MLYHLIDNALNHGTGKVYIVSTMGGLFPTVSVTNPIAAWDLDNDVETLAPASAFEGHLTAGSNKLGLEIVKRITEIHNITLDITQDAEVKTYQVTLRFN